MDSVSTPTENASSTPKPDGNGLDVVTLLNGIVVFILALLIIATNILNLYIIPRLPDINEASKVFYNSLSIADLFLGIVLLPALPSAIYGKWPLGDILCKIFGFGMTLVSGLSSGILLLLNLDRFFSISSPLRYIAIMNHRKALIMALTLCFFELLFLVVVIFLNPLGADIIAYSRFGACIVQFDEPKFAVYSIIVFTLCIWSFIPMLTIIYARIVCISRRHVRRIHIQEYNTMMNQHKCRVSLVHESGETLKVQAAITAQVHNKKMSRRALKMTFLVTGTYVAAWVPFTVCQIYVATVDHDFSLIVRALTCWPLLMNPLCNAIIYSATKRSYRHMARKILKGLLKCSLSDIRNKSGDIFV